MSYDKNNSRFQQGSGVYTCKCCGKQTRETGSSESQVEMCLACMEEAEAENGISDAGGQRTEEGREYIADFKKTYGKDPDPWCIG